MEIIIQCILDKLVIIHRQKRNWCGPFLFTGEGAICHLLIRLMFILPEGLCCLLCVAQRILLMSLVLQALTPRAWEEPLLSSDLFSEKNLGKRFPDMNFVLYFSDGKTKRKWWMAMRTFALQSCLVRIGKPQWLHVLWRIGRLMVSHELVKSL